MVLELEKTRLWPAFDLIFFLHLPFCRKAVCLFKCNAKSLFPALTDIFNTYQNRLYACTLLTYQPVAPHI